MNAARCFICQKYVFVKFGRKNNFGIKQVLFAGFFSKILLILLRYTGVMRRDEAMSRNEMMSKISGYWAIKSR